MTSPAASKLHRELFDKPASTPLLMRIARVLLAVTLPFARFLGADSVIVREIVETKLTIDLRRGTTLQRASGRKNIGMASNCLMMLVVGSAAAFALVFIRQPFFAMAIVQALMLYLLTAVLLTDYSDMVLGSVDDEILGPLPMQGRTLLVAQLLHVAIYLSLIVGCLLLPSLIVGCFTQPTLPWLAAMAVITPMTMACSLLGVVVAGLLIVRLVGPQRARQMLVTVQVVMTMFLMLAGQAPNLLRGTGAFDLLMAGDSYWLLLVPPLWFGGLYDVMVSGGTPMAGPLAMCAVVIPLLSLALALRLSRSHLTVSESSHALAKPSKGWLRRLGAKLCRTPCEQGAFALMLNLGHRERGFRMRCYPALVMPIVLLVPLSRHESAIQYIPLGCYYAMVFVVAMASQVRHTDTPDAAWIYRSLPLPLPGQLLSGTVLAIVVGFVLPWCLLVSLVSLVFVGPASLLSSALATTASLALSLTFAAWTLRDVPFSTRFVQSNQASQFGIAMLSFAASGVAAALHFGLGLLPYGRVCALPLAAAALWLALRTVRGLERRKVILPPSH